MDYPNQKYLKKTKVNISGKNKSSQFQ